MICPQKNEERASNGTAVNVPGQKLDYDALTPEQQARAKIVRRVEASSALEGYAPQAEIGGYAFELQKRWILGEIDTEQHIALLKKHHEEE